ncbi:hypothetical protein SFRURICE_009382 [Spodoptera frugiperda]|nr:hypothetical protein SFRURICE_009382 [Spodoptera frugiperda]
MKITSVVIFLSLVIYSYEKSTPQDDHYVGAVVEYTGADIVVFPELTLTNSSTTFEVPLYGNLRDHPVPALSPDLYDEFMVTISNAALQNDIYVVINGRELLDCTVQQAADEYCPEAKQYVFNTNVVFDRTGKVIDRFRKINLFGEFSHTPALRPDLGVFETDFGVSFGHFICFDLMFQVPAVQVVQKSKVKNVIFPTMWFSELPYLTGSGIYSGKAGALISIMPGLPTTKVLVAKVPKVPGQVTEPFPGPIYDDPANHDNLKLITDPSLPSHVTRLLEVGSQEFTLVDKDVSCTFKVTLAQREGNTPVYYRAFVQDGTNTYARREVGVAACLLVACKTDDVNSCPYRFNKQEEITVEKLEIEMRTHDNTYNDTLQCDNIEYFPVTVRYNKFPLSPKNFTYTVKEKDQQQCEPDDQNTISVLQQEILNRKSRETLRFKINVPQNELVAFGIWGRVYTRDVDHNKGASEEDIQSFNTLLDDIFSSE